MSTPFHNPDGVSAGLFGAGWRFLRESERESGVSPTDTEIWLTATERWAGRDNPSSRALPSRTYRTQTPDPESGARLEITDFRVGRRFRVLRDVVSRVSAPRLEAGFEGTVAGHHGDNYFRIREVADPDGYPGHNDWNFLYSDFDLSNIQFLDGHPLIQVGTRFRVTQETEFLNHCLRLLPGFEATVRRYQEPTDTFPSGRIYLEACNPSVSDDPRNHESGAVGREFSAYYYPLNAIPEDRIEVLSRPAPANPLRVLPAGESWHNPRGLSEDHLPDTTWRFCLSSERRNPPHDTMVWDQSMASFGLRSRALGAELLSSDSYCTQAPLPGTGTRFADLPEGTRIRVLREMRNLRHGARSLTAGIEFSIGRTSPDHPELRKLADITGPDSEIVRAYSHWYSVHDFTPGSFEVITMTPNASHLPSDLDRALQAHPSSAFVHMMIRQRTGMAIPGDLMDYESVSSWLAERLPASHGGGAVGGAVETAATVLATATPTRVDDTFAIDVRIDGTVTGTYTESRTANITVNVPRSIAEEGEDSVRYWVNEEARRIADEGGLDWDYDGTPSYDPTGDSVDDVVPDDGDIEHAVEEAEPADDDDDYDDADEEDDV